ncbi:MAG TPA: hypothetical protein VGI79_14325 [Caulobacteraceae bacterium]|jgi:hypothetical protein
MTVIFVENALESGNIVKITETFGGHSIHRDLRPGENARVSVSRYKSIVVEEVGLRSLENGAEAGPSERVGRWQAQSDTWPSFLQRRCG